VTALDGDAERRHVGDLDGVVLRGEDGLGQVAVDLLGVHIERGHELDVADVVLTELHMHQAGYSRASIGVAVVLDALNQRRRAVPDANDGHPHTAAVLAHAGVSFIHVAVCRCFAGRGSGVLAALLGLFVRDQLVEPTHLPLAGLQAEPVQFAGVAVDLFLGPGHGRT